MQRKLKRWWSTIPLILTKLTITSHLSLNDEKTMTYDIGHPCHGLGQVQQWVEVKPVNRIPNNLLISGSPMTIRIETSNNKRAQIVIMYYITSYEYINLV
jgi:hypothetical protein